MKGLRRNNNKKKPKKLNRKEVSKIFYETKWSKPSTKRKEHLRKNNSNQQKEMRVVMNVIELHGDKNASKMKQLRKSFKDYFENHKKLAIN